jgi:hypothetical protein
MRAVLASAQPSIGQPSGADVLLASVSWPGLLGLARPPSGDVPLLLLLLLLDSFQKVLSVH